MTILVIHVSPIWRDTWSSSQVTCMHNFSSSDFNKFPDRPVLGLLAAWRMAASGKDAKYVTLQSHIRLSADRGQDPRSFRWVGHCFSVRFGSANFSRERVGQTALVFVSAHFSRYSCFNVTHLHGDYFVIWPPGLVSAPYRFYFSFFFLGIRANYRWPKIRAVSSSSSSLKQYSFMLNFWVTIRPPFCDKYAITRNKVIK